MLINELWKHWKNIIHDKIILIYALSNLYIKGKNTFNIFMLSRPNILMSYIFEWIIGQYSSPGLKLPLFPNPSTSSSGISNFCLK